MAGKASESDPPPQPVPPHRSGSSGRSATRKDDKRLDTNEGTTSADPMANDPPKTESKNRPHVVLYRPEIPPNTGNIGRTCVALNATLWLVGPIQFDLSDARIRRSGLDYWQHLDIKVVDDWNTVTRSLSNHRFWFCSRHAQRLYWEPKFEANDVFVFGSESSGLPPEILDPQHDQSLRVPTDGKVRSLNLATTVGIILYEHRRQMDFHS